MILPTETFSKVNSTAGWELPNFEKLCGTGSNDISGVIDWWTAWSIVFKNHMMSRQCLQTYAHSIQQPGETRFWEPHINVILPVIMCQCCDKDWYYQKVTEKTLYCWIIEQPQWLTSITFENGYEVEQVPCHTKGNINLACCISIFGCTLNCSTAWWTIIACAVIEQSFHVEKRVKATNTVSPWVS